MLISPYRSGNYDYKTAKPTRTNNSEGLDPHFLAGSEIAYVKE